MQRRNIIRKLRYLNEKKNKTKMKLKENRIKLINFGPAFRTCKGNRSERKDKTSTLLNC